MDARLETRSGRVRGSLEDGVFVFRGVPYAGPASGEFRWRPPGAPEAWSGERDATRGGPDAQQFREQVLLFDAEDRAQAEDAPLLNVWTPELGAGGRPIMVFIHGGGFEMSGGMRALYSGQHLAMEGDVVVVTINYRLGIFGLLSSSELRDADTGVAANWLMLDQIAALKWVREHAALIGGDPNRVTIFGESAGGVSVGLLAVSPLAKGLFQKVIVQSGAPIPIPAGQAERGTEALCKQLGVAREDIASLRDLPFSKLRTAYPAWREHATRQGYALRPSQDGVVLPAPTYDLLDAGATRDLEIVVGTNRDELSIMSDLDPTVRSLDEAGLRQRIGGLLRSEARADAVIRRYQEQHEARGLGIEPPELYASINTAYFIRNDSYSYLEKHVASGGVGYAYLVDWESPQGRLRACHGIELPFCFGTLETAPGARAFAGDGAEALALRDRMLHAWAGFAHGRGRRAFGPAFDAQKRSTMCFGPDSGPVEAPLDWEREAWRGL